MTRATDRALSTAEMHAFGEELDAIRDRVIGSLGASPSPLPQDSPKPAKLSLKDRAKRLGLSKSKP